MSSKKETLDFVLNQVQNIEDISSRKMMGEYLIYYKKKVIGGIYDDRFLVKKTKDSVLLLPDAAEDIPYEGAKPMLSMSDLIFDEHPGNAILIEKVFKAIYNDI